jgi:hypothetical protein
MVEVAAVHAELSCRRGPVLAGSIDRRTDENALVFVHRVLQRNTLGELTRARPRTTLVAVCLYVDTETEMRCVDQNLIKAAAGGARVEHRTAEDVLELSDVPGPGCAFEHV